jgi:hypothetical protein
VTDKEVASYVEGMLTGRPAQPFEASPEQVEVLRAAIALRAGHPSGVAPDPWFVDDLHHQLAAIGSDPGPPPGRPAYPDTTRSGGRRAGRPWWTPVGKAAAALVIAAASITAVVAEGHRSAAPVAQAASKAVSVRAATLLASDGRPLGRAYAYGGNPSWVFMDVRDSGLSGAYVCELHMTNGTTTAAGLVTVYDGTGDWAHTVRVEARQVRQATLVTPSGVAVASATFS